MTEPVRRDSILFVTPSLSAEARSGGEVRTQRLLQALSAAAPVELVALGARSSADELKAATGCQVVHAFPVEQSGLRKRLRALRRCWPLPVSGWYHPRASALVREAAHFGRVIVFDHVWVATTSATGGQLVLATQNAEAQLLVERPLPTRAIRRLEAKWNRWATARLERRAVAAADLVVTVTGRDAEVMGVRSLVVPNGADLPRLVEPRPEGGDVLFVGSLDYPPNEQAVRWWADEIWPGLSDIPPLTVVGRNADRILADLRGHPGLRLVGEVPDVSIYLRSATLVVVPLLEGGGTRLKVLEALAWGRPVVSTTKGVEGLPVDDRAHVLIADGRQAFAEAVSSLYQDRDLALGLAERGRVLVEDFRWEQLSKPFVASVLSLRSGRLNDVG